MNRRTFAAKNDGQIPEFRHVERFENLSLIACAVAVQGKCDFVPTLILVRKSDARANGDLRADNAVAAVETWSEHVHTASFSKSNAFSST